MNKASAENLAEAALVNGNEIYDTPFITLGPAPAPVRLLGNKGDILLMEFSSADAKVFVIIQTFTKDWRAFVDGKPARLFPVYRVWTGLYVPAGEHDIELMYAPLYSPNYIRYWIRVNWGS